MKKLYAILFTICLTVASFAQQLPNNGFEEWSTAAGNPDAVNPNGFTSSNQCYQPVSLVAIEELCIKNVEKTTDKHGGSFAAKLTIGSEGASQVAAVLTTGDFLQELNEEYIPNPVPFNGRPGSVSAFVKYTPVNEDEATIGVAFYDGDEVIGGAYITISETNDTYYKIEEQIEYDEEFTGTPDGISVFISAGSKSGSVFFVDDIEFSYITTSAYSSVSPVSLFTNADGGNLHFSEKVKDVTFTDMTGKTTQTSGASTQDVSTVGMQAGLYMVRYTYNSNTYVGKIVLQ